MPPAFGIMELRVGTYGSEAMDWADKDICSRWFERNDMSVEGEGESEGDTDTWWCCGGGCSLASQQWEADEAVGDAGQGNAICLLS